MKKILITILLFFILTSNNAVRADGGADAGAGGGGGGNNNNTSLEYKTGLDTSTSMEDLICNVLGFLTGGVGKALAAFACMGIALAFLGGKVSWTLILTFSLGMACIFGAPTIIKAFTGGTAACSDK